MHRLGGGGGGGGGGADAVLEAARAALPVPAPIRVAVVVADGPEGPGEDGGSYETGEETGDEIGRNWRGGRWLGGGGEVGRAWWRLG